MDYTVYGTSSPFSTPKRLSKTKSWISVYEEERHYSGKHEKEVWQASEASKILLGVTNGNTFYVAHETSLLVGIKWAKYRPNHCLNRLVSGNSY